MEGKVFKHYQTVKKRSKTVQNRCVRFGAKYLPESKPVCIENLILFAFLESIA